MPQLIALEWDSREMRVAVASGRGRQVVVEHAFSLALETSEPPSEEQIGRQIAEALDARNLGRPEAVVAVGRSSIELRQLQLPPAPDEDLPELVQFQATREFNELDDRWRLDFVPIDEASDGPRSVLAMAIAPTVVGQIEAVCRHAGLVMRRLLLRPCEAASLVTGGQTDVHGPLTLLAAPMGNEADLVAVVQGKAVFLRTTRLAGDPPPLAALAAEIRLTMAAAHNQLGGRPIQSILLCGHDQNYTDLARGIETELGLHVELFDPFAGLTLSPALKASLPVHPGRFAPVLGMLLGELKSSSHAIDFLHPRQRAEAPNPRKKWMIAGAVAASLFVAYMVYARIDRALLIDEVDQLEKKSKSLDDAIGKAKKVRGSTAEIGRWADEDAIWLDWLQAIHQGFPPAEDALLGQVTVSANAQGGQVDLKGWVRRSETIARLEEGVRARAGTVSAKSSREDRSIRPYAWAFEATVQKGKDAKP